MFRSTRERLACRRRPRSVARCTRARALTGGTCPAARRRRRTVRRRRRRPRAEFFDDHDHGRTMGLQGHAVDQGARDRGARLGERGYGHHSDEGRRDPGDGRDEHTRNDDMSTAFLQMTRRTDAPTTASSQTGETSGARLRTDRCDGSAACRQPTIRSVRSGERRTAGRTRRRRRAVASRATLGGSTTSMVATSCGAAESAPSKTRIDRSQ